MKKTIHIVSGFILLGVSSAVLATGAGFYVGAQGGVTNTHPTDQLVHTGTVPATQMVSPSQSGYGGRFFLGANINQYAGVELGATHYGTTTYKPSVSALCSTPTIKENAADLVGKGMIPFADSGFDAFGKAGISVISVSRSGSLQTSPSTLCGSSQSSTAVRPTATVGVSYDLTPSWVAEVSWNRVFSGGGAVQNLDLVALGIAYHFVDHYCGQFLC